LRRGKTGVGNSICEVGGKNVNHYKAPPHGTLGRESVTTYWGDRRTNKNCDKEHSPVRSCENRKDQGGGLHHERGNISYVKQVHHELESPEKEETPLTKVYSGRGTNRKN